MPSPHCDSPGSPGCWFVAERELNISSVRVFKRRIQHSDHLVIFTELNELSAIKLPFSHVLLLLCIYIHAFIISLLTTVFFHPVMSC